SMLTRSFSSGSGFSIRSEYNGAEIAFPPRAVRDGRSPRAKCLAGGTAALMRFIAFQSGPGIPSPTVFPPHGGRLGFRNPFPTRNLLSNFRVTPPNSPGLGRAFPGQVLAECPRSPKRPAAPIGWYSEAHTPRARKPRPCHLL